MTPKHVAGIYQLYPKPDGTPKGQHRRRKPKKVTTGSNRQMRCEGDYRYSFNELWRINVKTAEIQHRKSRRFGLWRVMTDYERGQVIPKAILKDFDLCLSVSYELQQELQSVTDDAQSVTDDTQSVTDDRTALIF